jgi:hypothetical protein
MRFHEMIRRSIASAGDRSERYPITVVVEAGGAEAVRNGNLLPTPAISGAILLGSIWLWMRPRAKPHPQLNWRLNTGEKSTTGHLAN